MRLHQPHTKSEQIFNCPSHTTTQPYSFRNGVNYGSYAINASYAGNSTFNGVDPTSPSSDYNNGGAAAQVRVTLASIVEPANTVWATDIEKNGTDDRFYRFAWTSANPTDAHHFFEQFLARGLHLKANSQEMENVAVD